MNNITENQELSMPKMPVQQWTTIYDFHTGLKEGTIFPDLNKPFYMGGDLDGKQNAVAK